MRDQQTMQRSQAFLADSPRPASAAAMAGAAHASLDAAVAMARAGDRQSARELCAAIMFDRQPLLASRPQLLRATLHALLIAHGFKLLSRLVLAMSGRNVRMTLVPVCAGPITSPRARQDAGRTIYPVDSRWLESVCFDDMVFVQWCDALLGHRPGSAATPACAAM